MIHLLRLIILAGSVSLAACMPSLNEAFGMQSALDSWIGRSVDELKIEWGLPSKTYRLENSNTVLLVYHQLRERPRRDIDLICEMVGNTARSLLCPDGVDECTINVAASPDGYVSRVTIVRGGVLPVLGTCLAMVKPAPTKHR